MILFGITVMVGIKHVDNEYNYIINNDTGKVKTTIHFLNHTVCYAKPMYFGKHHDSYPLLWESILRYIHSVISVSSFRFIIYMSTVRAQEPT